MFKLNKVFVVKKQFPQSYNTPISLITENVDWELNIWLIPHFVCPYLDCLLKACAGNQGQWVLCINLGQAILHYTLAWYCINGSDIVEWIIIIGANIPLCFGWAKRFSTKCKWDWCTFREDTGHNSLCLRSERAFTKKETICSKSSQWEQNCSFPLRKHAYSNILRILPPKNENFSWKILIVFTILHRRGGSNEYPQSMFLSRNKKNNVYPCKPWFYCIKV